MSNDVVVQEPKNVIVPVDNGKQALYNPAAFAQIWRAAQMFSSSDLVPTAYKNKPENCFIAIEMADRMGISPFAMLQSLVIIQGKPSMEAKLIIALVNDSGIFEDPLEYEISGDDPHADSYKVRCFAKMKKSGKLCQGPWITYKMVKGEGWLDKGGSKWKTMPSIMFMYRAASFFAKVYCPNITMGMQTREEMDDVQMVDVTPARPVAPELVAALQIARDTAPALAAVTETVAGETVIVETGEVVEKRTRRTKAEMAASQAAAQVVDPEPVIEPVTDDGFPGLPTEEQPPHPADEVVIEAEAAPVETVPETVGDLF